jgi:DAK2 domain fusion protein YloV
MTRLACDGPTLIRAVAGAIANLERHVAEVDALNVFPVPDGDTGSNMLATMRASLAEAEALAGGERDIGRVAAALARGALRGARGNSGVILAQIVVGMSLGVDGRRRATGIQLADGLRRGAGSAYRSVVSPVEGTILTVIRDAAEAAAVAATDDRRVEAVLGAAIDAAARSVAGTPGLLPVLADAGVVDSGGLGLLRLLEGARQLDTHAGSAGRLAHAGPPRTSGTRAPHAHPGHAHDGGYGYETVFFLEPVDGGLDVEALRHELGDVGESVVVAGDRTAARVHVHGAHPDLAIAVGLRTGRLSDVAIVDLDAEVEPVALDRAGALVAVAEADGLAAVLASLGALVVRSPDAVGDAARAVDAERSIVLVAGDRATSDADEGAITGASVVRVRDVGALVAAALAFDAASSVEANVARMMAEAARVRSFAIADAPDLAEATVAGLRSHGASGFELATLYTGPRVGVAAVDAVRAAIAAAWPEVQVDAVLGAGPDDALLVALD